MTGEIPHHTRPSTPAAGHTHGVAAAVGLLALLGAGCTLVAASPVATLAWHVGVLALLAAGVAVGGHACACALTFAKLRSPHPHHRQGPHPPAVIPGSLLHRDRARSYDRPGWRSVFDLAAELRLACAVAGTRRGHQGSSVTLCLPPALDPPAGWAPWAFWGDLLHTRAVLATVLRQAVHAAGPGPWEGPLHMAVRVDTARQVVVLIQPFGGPCDLARQGRCAPAGPSPFIAGGVVSTLLATAILPMHCPPGAVRDKGCCTLPGYLLTGAAGGGGSPPVRTLRPPAPTALASAVLIVSSDEAAVGVLRAAVTDMGVDPGGVHVLPGAVSILTTLVDRGTGPVADLLCGAAAGLATLAFVDLNLVDGDGHDLCAQARARGSTAHFVAIAAGPRADLTVAHTNHLAHVGFNSVLWRPLRASLVKDLVQVVRAPCRRSDPPVP
jgi:CheY-like chemotaxis protein